MDRLALIVAFFISLLIATNGSMSSASAAARKGYHPRLGALAGAGAGFMGGIVPALILLNAVPGRSGLAVLASLIGSVGVLIALWHLAPDRDPQRGDLPQGAALQRNIVSRRTRGAIMRGLFIASIAVALLALAILLGSIVSRTIGLTAVQYAVQPEDLLVNGAASGRPVKDLSDAELSAALAENIRVARLRVFLLQEVAKAPQDRWSGLSAQPVSAVLAGKPYPESLAETPLSKLNESEAADLLARNLSRRALEELLFDEAIQPEVVQGWTLWESLVDRDRIEAITADKYPNAELHWRSWVNRDFLTGSLDPRKPDATGLRPALYGSLLVIVITMAVAFPVGVGAAIYLEEYAGDHVLNRIIQTNISNLAGVPSIIYGMLGLAIFVRALAAITSGTAFGADTANGRTVLSAGFTLALLILPLIIINAQEAIRAVPGSLRQASYGLGATKWQTIWNHVLPYAMPGIMTGTILAVSRAIGETAPLVLVGGATFLTQDPKGPFSIFTALPLLIYRWTTLPQAEFRNAAAAAIVVLLIMLLTLNSLAIILRNRFSRRLS
jgi:phosphate transport system permease protein